MMATLSELKSLAVSAEECCRMNLGAKTRADLASFRRYSPEFVIAHGCRQMTRGKRPSLSFGRTRNPHKAFLLAHKAISLKADMIYLDCRGSTQNHMSISDGWWASLWEDLTLHSATLGF